MSEPHESDIERLERLVQRAQRDVVAVIGSAMRRELDFERLTTLRDALMLRDPDLREELADRAGSREVFE